MWKVIEHNRYLFGAIAASVVLSVWFASCAPTTESIVTPGLKVTASELQREVIAVQKDYDVKLASAEIAKAELARKQEQRARIVELASGVGQLALTGGLNPVAGLGAGVQLLTLLGLGGAVIDNRRKDKVIKKEKAKAQA